MELPPESPAEPAISIIVPAHDEAGYLPGLLESLARLPRGEVEVIVVDNGSSDGTSQLLAAASPLVRTVSIGKRVYPSVARNVGVAASAGTVVVFLDADVVVTAQWREALQRWRSTLDEQPRTLAGDQYQLSQSPSWIERWWFGPLRRQPKAYINGGNIVTTRQLFDTIGGFDEQLETGEDVDFCTRAVQDGGARLVLDQQFAVHHEGFPKTVAAFVRRERWHGVGDLGAWGTLARSKVALMSVVFLGAHVGLIASLALAPMNARAWWLAALSALAILLVCSLSSWRRFHGHGPAQIGAGAVMSYLYFAGRALSLVDVATRRR